MKKYIIIIIIILVDMIFYTSWVNAQVVIGSDANVNEGSLLDLKENGLLGANAKHGLLLPRVSLRKADYLYPMLDNLPEYKHGTPTKTKEDLVHTGLVVYNLTTDEAENLCEGAYMWDSEKWTRLGRSCPLPICEYKIESNLTPNLYYRFYCNDFSTLQQDALQQCRTVTNNDGNKTYTYHLMTYKEFVETWNQDIDKFPLESKYYIDNGGWVTLGIIRADGTMEVLNDVSPFPFGPPIGGLIQGMHTVRCARDK